MTTTADDIVLVVDEHVISNSTEEEKKDVASTTNSSGETRQAAAQNIESMLKKNHSQSSSELKKVGKLPQNTDLAPALQGIARKLQRNLISDTVSRNLSSRDLKGKNKQVFQADNVAPKLQSKKLKLEHALRANHVNRSLKQRSTQEELKKKGSESSLILRFYLSAADLVAFLSLYLNNIVFAHNSCFLFCSSCY